MKTALFTVLFIFANLEALPIEISYTLVKVSWDRLVIYRSNKPVDIRNENFSKEILCMNVITHSPVGIYWGYGVMYSNVPKNMGISPISITETFTLEDYFGPRLIAGFSKFIFAADVSIARLEKKWFRSAYTGLTIPLAEDSRINVGIETMFSEKIMIRFGMRVGITASLD